MALQRSSLQADDLLEGTTDMHVNIVRSKAARERWMDTAQCVTCHLLCTKEGGQTRGEKMGRPAHESSKRIANTILRNAPKSWGVLQPLPISRLLPTANKLPLASFQCIFCLYIVSQLVEMPCGKFAYAGCISKRV